MNYQVLARRYRPRSFEEVVGQESIAATLRGGIQQDRIAHAYLFAGPRGVGKTSMARIFAKALNCPKASDAARGPEHLGEPCNECSTCEAIHLGQDIDVVELDGASHRGIEEVRTILEGVNRPATRSPYKVYIVDEVHMLTREAFNAFLKTLEEPPAHVKFFFATTEPHRIPETVLSRCQRFDFHPIGEDAIVRRLAQILSSEGRSGEEGLLEKIARYGKGGMRDAQTLLDQLMTYSEGPLRVEDLEKITGRVPEDSVAGLAEAVMAGEPGTVLEQLRACFVGGADPSVLLEQMVDDVRARVRELVRKQPEEGPSGPSLDKLLAFLQILVDAAAKLKYSPFAEVSVEVVLLKLSRLEEPATLEDVLRKLGEIESREGLGGEGEGPARLPPRRAPELVPSRAPMPSPPRVPPSAAPQEPAPVRASNAGRAESSTPAQAPEPAHGVVQARPPGAPDFRHLESLWDQVQVEVEQKRPSIAPYLKDLRPLPVPGEAGTFRLELESEFHLRQMRATGNQQALLDVVRDVTGSPWRVRIIKVLEGSAPGRQSPEARQRSAGGGPPPPPSQPLPLAATGDAAAGEGGAVPGPSRGDAGSGSPSAGGPVTGEGTAAGAPPAQSPRESGAPRSGEITRSAIVKKSLDLFNGRIV